MSNQSVLRILILSGTALTVSLATAQSLYTPTVYPSSAVSYEPIAPIAAPQWQAPGGQALALADQGNPAVLPAGNGWAAAPGQPATVPVLLPGAHAQQPVQPTIQPVQMQVTALAKAGAPVFSPGVQPSAQALAGVEPAQANPFAASPFGDPAGQAPQTTDNPFVSASLPPEQAAPPRPNAAPFLLNQSDRAALQQEAGEAAAHEEVDIGALRYYASKRDLPRVGAEMRRLKLSHPGWEPPSDLFSPQNNVDEQPLWDRFALGDYSGVRARIANYKSVNPEWNPSEELSSKLLTAEARLSLERAFASGNGAEVISIASSRPELLVCNQMQTLWNVGETLARMQEYARAFELYKYILTNCDNPSERLATVQKLSLVLPEPGISALIAMGRILPDGTSEFEDVSFNPLRSAMGKVSAGDDLLAPPISEAELRRFAAFVQRHQKAEDAGLFGWYYFSKQQYDASHAWFSAASYIKKDPKLLEGVILSLRRLDRTKEAFDFARKTRDLSPDLSVQYVQIIAEALTKEDSDLKLSDEEFSEYQEIVSKTESALGAQAIGWSLVAKKDYRDAREWFGNSVDWEISKGGVIGLAVVASRLRHYKTLASIRRKYGDQYDELSRIR
ncbi:hypothetical protein [Hoeflea ulvae]|uniref:Cellulose synthase n=1 Tax=Hoeflea ulvae TaxID=2983764 RepID=A0ABT3YGB7_9HYPH|nr:hypothetical protein [Hoeflea ulvae]MCY0094911.1 hypothetical protein [Hoeflea ulvae]